MTDRAKLTSALETLNTLLCDVTPYKLAVAPPGELKPADKNAHYMERKTLEQLTANVKKDKNLSSLPFCWRQANGAFVILSGHHRVQAANEAGVELVLFLYTDAELTRSEQIAIQLSHNALNGQDNPNLLADLWREIDDLGAKVYSGLDDQFIEKLTPPKFAKIEDAALRFEQLTLFFVQPEIERIGNAVRALQAAPGKTKLVAPMELFDQFFETLLNFKEASGIQNSSTAFMAMIEIVERWMVEQEGVEQANEAEQPSGEATDD